MKFLRWDLEAWRLKDPLERYTRVLIESKDATGEELATIDEAIAVEVDREVQLAEQSPLPEAGVVLQNVYANGAIVEVEPANMFARRQP